MSGIGPLELVLVAIIALVVLGPKRLPEAGKSLGRGMREFKHALQSSDPRQEDAPRAESPPREGAAGAHTDASAADAPEPESEPQESKPERAWIEVEQTCKVLGELAAELEPGADPRAFDGVLRYEPEEQRELGVTLDLRRDTSTPAGEPDLVIRTPAEVAHRFWAGLMHEPAELLRGRLLAEGPLKNALRVLPPLRALGQLYCDAVGAASAPIRFEVLQAFAVDPETLPPSLPHDMAVPGAPAALAATIVRGLPPICRAIEITAIVRGFREGAIAADDLAAVLEALDEIGEGGHAAGGERAVAGAGAAAA